MKSFTDFKSAFNWVDKVVSKTSEQAIEDIAKQTYEDSKEFTYIDTQDMYDSGENSDFKNGYVLIKAPQVRWLYYTSGINAGPGNRQAVPQWFERTKIENMKDYIKIYSSLFNKNKG